MSARPIPLHLLNSTATIGRPSTTPDSQGGHARTYPAVETSVRCRIRPLSLAERNIGHREEVDATHRVYMLPDEDVRRGDQLTIGGSDYDVMFIRQPSETGSHQEIDVRIRVLGGA
jgi:SPP1 family predicted phage head-tail adaptor